MYQASKSGSWPHLAIPASSECSACCAAGRPNPSHRLMEPVIDLSLVESSGGNGSEVVHSRAQRKRPRSPSALVEEVDLSREPGECLLRGIATSVGNAGVSRHATSPDAAMGHVRGRAVTHAEADAAQQLGRQQSDGIEEVRVVAAKTHVHACPTAATAAGPSQVCASGSIG